MPSEFDNFAAGYDDLLRDPLRTRFAGHGGFFHVRKAILIRDFLTRRGADPRACSLLDVGCGRGEFLRLARRDFGSAFGCDPSREMLKQSPSPDVRFQPDPLRIPFDDGVFDVVTVICVLHHVAPADRPKLIREVRRVLRPGGLACLIEHNPYNPATRLIVSRTPVDRGAQLLSARSVERLLAGAGLRVLESRYFLYLPHWLYARASAAEDWLRRVPLGGQHAVFALKL